MSLSLSSLLSSSSLLSLSSSASWKTSRGVKQSDARRPRELRRRPREAMGAHRDIVKASESPVSAPPSSSTDRRKHLSLSQMTVPAATIMASWSTVLHLWVELLWVKCELSIESVRRVAENIESLEPENAERELLLTDAFESVLVQVDMLSCDLFKHCNLPQRRM